MLGLLSPQSGTISLPYGPDSTAYLPQSQGTGQEYPGTVWEVALSGCQRSGLFSFYSREDKERAREALSSLGIADLARRRMRDLSGGQRQRAYLARSLCRDPRLLLLDEPYTSLDPKAADGLSRVLASLRNDRGIAILMSSHDLGAVAANASRVLVLDGQLLFDGNVHDWLKTYHNRDVCDCGFDAVPGQPDATAASPARNGAFFGAGV